MKKKHEFKLWQEFKAFINRGSALDLAVGMIIGSAFTAIVNSLVKGILQPLINMIPLGQDGKSLQVVLRDPVIDATTGAVVKEAVIMDFGAVISAIVTFLLTALVLFLIVKAINKAREIGGKEKARLEQLAQKVTKKNGDAETTEAPAEVAVAEERLFGFEIIKAGPKRSCSFLRFDICYPFSVFVFFPDICGIGDFMLFEPFYSSFYGCDDFG